MIYSGGDRHTQELLYWLEWAKVQWSEQERKAVLISTAYVWAMMVWLIFTSWGSAIRAGSGKQLCSQCGRTGKFISTGNYSHPDNSRSVMWRGRLTFPRIWCSGPLGAGIWRGGAVPCQARLEGSHLLPSASVIALVIVPRVWILHSSACFPADTKILIIML